MVLPLPSLPGDKAPSHRGETRMDAAVAADIVVEEVDDVDELLEVDTVIDPGCDIIDETEGNDVL